jgi:hypothetical protein
VLPSSIIRAWTRSPSRAQPRWAASSARPRRARGKKLSLELGGKSPFIVHEDADLDAAVEGVVDAIWFNQGQVCCAGSRILVQEGIAPKFLAKLKRRMETLRVGDPLDKSIDMGAIVDPVQLSRITELVEKGKAEGGTLVQASCDLPKTGNWFAPSFFTDVEPASTVMDVEIFGPVAAVMTFRTPEEAVQIANHTRYGLAATVWSENINLALDTAARVKAGVVWVNATNLFDAAAGFGGYRESGFGREGGREGMHEYLVPAWEAALKPEPDGKPAPLSTLPPEAAEASVIDRTAKLYIGGKQARPDSGIPIPYTEQRARRSASPASEAARTSAMRWRQRPRLPPGPRHQRTAAPRFSTTSRRTSPPAPRNSRPASGRWGRAPGRRRRRSTPRSPASSGMPRRLTNMMAASTPPSPAT